MGPSFLDLVDPKRWQLIQDYFAEVIGASIRVVDANGAPLTKLSKPINYCFEVISSSPHAFKHCTDCVLFSPQPHSKDKLLSEQDFFLEATSDIGYDYCPFYVSRVIIPVKFLDKKIAAYIIIGPVIIGKRRSYPDYFQLSKKLELDFSQLIEALDEIKIFSFQSFESILNLFQEVADYIVQDKFKKKEPQPEKGKSVKVDKPAIHYYLEKLLQALFETVCVVTQAERVSVMLLDYDNKTLAINLAKGLPGEVVQNTQLKLGEGLAGWAAKENAVLVIDNEFNNRLLLSRLHQPNLKSALIVPIKGRKIVWGILNISTYSEECRFDKANINAVVYLVKLVENALQNMVVDSDKVFSH